MKSSHHILMVAILLGVIAWFCDALIRWQFYPELSYLDVLFLYEGALKLVYRALIVLVFISFGLVLGWMMDLIEKQRRRALDHVCLLDGVNELERIIGSEKDPYALLDQAKELLKDVFRFSEVYLIHLDPHKNDKVSYHSTSLQHPDHDECMRILSRSLEEPFPERSNPAISSGTFSRDFSSGKFLFAPLVYDETVHGGLLGTWKDKQITLNGDVWKEQFQSACMSIGQALSHLNEIEESKRTTLRVRKLHDLSPLGVFVATRSGQVEYMNPAMSLMLAGGRSSAKDWKGSNFREWFEHPESCESFLARLDAVKEISDVECTFRRHDGEVMQVMMAARLCLQDPVEASYVEGYVLDMTAHLTLARSNQELQRELEKSHHYQAISVLAGGVAHDFNNILQIIMSSVNLAQEKVGHSDEELAGYLAEIQHSGDRAAQLCDQMLAYAGKKVVRKMLLDADAELEHVLSRLNRSSRNKVPCHLNLGAPGVKVHFDTSSLSEVVRNLYENAQDALEQRPEGSLVVSTSVMSYQSLESLGYHFHRTLHEDHYWVMSCKDEGTGIDSGCLHRIFDPFFTTKFQGRGLGLCAAMGILDKLDGTLGVKSTLGLGTEFVLCLPVADSVVVLPDPPPRDLPLHSSADAGSRRLWLLDDEPMIGESVMRILVNHGYAVQVESDPTIFMERFTKREFERTHCVLLDMILPKVSGLEVLRWIRERSDALPVLIISALDELEHRESIERLKVSGYIQKPFHSDELLTQLGRVSGSRVSGPGYSGTGFSRQGKTPP